MPSFTNAPAQADEQLMALRALKARYPYMFVRPHIGQDFYRGWLADFIVACNAIDELLGADKRGFHFRQLKEKYGWARYYWATDQVTPLRLSLIANGGVLERQYGLDSADRVDQQICQILLAAEKSLAAGTDAAFMKAKIATARFYADHILTRVPGTRDAIVDGADSVTALALESF